MRYCILLFSFMLALSTLKAQQDFVFENNTYVDNISTVRFGPNGFQHIFPLLTLNAQGQLLLSFDDFDAGVKNYLYSVIHCDRDWKPSTLSKLEYIDGFDEDNIYDFDFSFRTSQNYTHYQLWFPNEDMGVSKTGNYLLVVYENEDEKIPVITRRFVVVDNKVSIETKLVRPARVSEIHSHQEIDFSINHAQLNVRNPMLELRATVIQNQRWDNALTEIGPRFIHSNKTSFDYQSLIVFPAGNEFRLLDLRSLQAPQSDIDYVNVLDNGTIEAKLASQVSRKKKGVHLAYIDINGAFLIENFDQRSPTLNGEYAEVLFVYKVDQPYVSDHVYLIGDITEWQVKHKYQLRYNPAISAYVGRFSFKMGFYNYFFATVPSDADPNESVIPSIDKTEGSFADTENDYLILIYYKPFGSRYDQVVGAYSFNTVRR